MPTITQHREDLQKALKDKRADVQSKRAAFEAKKKELEAADNVDPTNPEDPAVKAADDAMKPWSQAADELRVMEGQFERLTLMELDGGGNATDPRTENQLDTDQAQLNAIRESVGRAAVESDAYQQMKASGAFEDGSEIPFKGELAHMELDAFVSLLTGTSGSAGASALPQNNRLPGIYDIPRLPLGIFDLITVGETAERTVEFVRLLARTINAAEVAEASSAAIIGDGTGGTATTTTGGVKPESGLTFEVVTEAVKTIAHWIPGTRNMLADAPFLRTLVDSELLQGVERRAETQVMQGNGTGQNIRGLYNQTGLNSYVQGTADAGESNVDALHRILTVLRLLGYNPNAFAVHPNDWEDVRLSKDDNGNYLWGPPSQAGQEQVWGLPVAQTIAATEGLPMAGEWRRAMFLVREAARVLVSDSHADFFVRNLIAILAEARGVLVVPRPQAFGQVDLT
jgi:HK97 family phage major capsid protein